MTEHRHICAITGTGGFIGSHIVSYYQKNGWRVFEMSRKAKATEGNILYVLGHPLKPDALAGVDTLIHCAYDFAPRTWDDIERINVEGTRRLFETAEEADVPNKIFISSVSSYKGCESLYGKAKFAIEQEAEQLGLTIIRPGLVYGKNTGGIVGSMQKVATQNLVVPLIGSGNDKQCLTHIDDLCELLYQISSRKVSLPKPGQPITAASEQLFTFREIIQELASAKNKRPLLLPVPWPIVYGILRVAEAVRFPMKLRSDSVIGAVKYNRNLDFSATRQLPVRFRVFRASEL